MKWAIAGVLAALFVGDVHSARAFTISSAVSPGCHERISAEAFALFLEQTEPPKRAVSLPPKWARVAYGLADKMGVEATTDVEAFVLLSLIVGVRSPDTGGHSVANITQLRSLHADPDPDGQYLHALRAPDDDGPEGNATAIAGTRRAIERTLQLALDAFRAPVEERFGEAIMYVDFYGEVPVPVWWPAYYLGRAAHTVQDGFGHMLRDRATGLHEIVYVLNYVDAITLSYREARDGLPHSGGMDSCAGETKDAVTGATQATRELLNVMTAAVRQNRDPSLSEFLDRWFVLHPGCTVENEMCGNPDALAIARKKPTGPYLPLQRRRSKRLSKKQ